MACGPQVLRSIDDEALLKWLRWPVPPFSVPIKPTQHIPPSNVM